jgi:Flp pilus assembly protein TadD
MKRTLFAFLAAALALAGGAGGGCASGNRSRDASKSGYETLGAEPQRQTDSAQLDNARAVELMNQGKYDEAESVLKSALTADVMHGPAHNNLGKVYYHQGRLYLAAWEFQYAAKLMPHQPEPLNNLGLVFEAAGKLDDAVTSYGKAMSFEPDNPQFIGNLARARVRRGEGDDADVRELLSKLVMRDTRPDWVEWARRRLATTGHGAASER